MPLESGNTIRKWLPFTLVGLLGVIFVVSISIGSVSVRWLDYYQILFNTEPTQSNHSLKTILFEIRWPRATLAAIVGFALGITGACLQGLFRNPLADPSLIGVSAGASLGAGVAIVFSGLGLIGAAHLPLLQIAFAFIFALLTVALIVAIASINSSHGGGSVVTMLLAGIAITALVGATTSLLKFYTDENQLRLISLWQMGSLQGHSWRNVVLALLFCGGSSVYLLCFSRALNALLLGETEAQSLGINVSFLKIQLIVFVALAVSAAVSLTGVIGFIGLLAPHCVRLLTGPNHKYVLINSALLGALLLLASDVLSRLLVPPLVIPVGIITAVIGAPFFLWLLIRFKGGYRW